MNEDDKIYYYAYARFSSFTPARRSYMLHALFIFPAPILHIIVFVKVSHIHSLWLLPGDDYSILLNISAVWARKIQLGDVADHLA